MQYFAHLLKPELKPELKPGSSGVDTVLAFIVKLRQQLDIPHDLKFIGIDASRIPAIAEMATHDPSASGNPLLLSKDDYAVLLANVIKGVLN